MIEFVASLRDVEMRSGDTVGFLYVGQELRLIQNFTVSRFTPLTAPTANAGPGGDDMAVVVKVLVAIVLVVIFVFILASLHK